MRSHRRDVFRHPSEPQIRTRGVSGWDPAGAGKREEHDHEQHDRRNAQRDVELRNQIILAARFLIHRVFLCRFAIEGRANLAGFDSPVDQPAAQIDTACRALRVTGG